MTGRAVRTMFLAAILVASVPAVGACGGGTAAPSSGGGSSAPASSGAAEPRPSSPATVAITAPTTGETVEGTTVHVVLSLTGATITPTTTTDIRPDQGHVHLYVDNVLVSMNYGLEQDLPVHPGTYLLKAEFVAADHAPFSPRVWSNEVIFTVK